LVLSYKSNLMSEVKFKTVNAFGSEQITAVNIIDKVNNIFDPLELSKKMDDYSLQVAHHAEKEQGAGAKDIREIMDDFRLVRQLLSTMKELHV